MNTDIGTVEVCTDCYFAHHFGARKIERPATEQEVNYFEHGHNDRAIMGLTEWASDDGENWTVVEWFAGESDERCEGGEPLAELPEYGHVSGNWRVTSISDFTCANHDFDTPYSEAYDEDDPDQMVEPCTHCGQAGWETGITEFTWRSCDGCASNLGGSRYRLAIHWKEVEHAS